MYKEEEKKLSDHDADIVKMRCSEKKSLEEIAKKYNVTRERIRQVLASVGEA